MEVDRAFDLIARAIDENRAAHGYLIVGDLRGACDELIARTLAKLFPGAHSQIEGRCHPDVAWLEPEGKKRIITVEAMRTRIVGPMDLTSYSGGWKVGVIFGADRMQAESANALLKSLEEPTPKTLYLLATDQPDFILPTILSRTQRVELPITDGFPEGETADAIAEAFAARRAAALAETLETLKAEADEADLPIVRKAFYRTILRFVRAMMLKSTLPAYQAFRNVEAVEEAYRQSERGLKDDAVISFLIDRIVFPTKPLNPLTT